MKRKRVAAVVSYASALILCCIAGPRAQGRVIHTEIGTIPQLLRSDDHDVLVRRQDESVTYGDDYTLASVLGDIDKYARAIATVRVREAWKSLRDKGGVDYRGERAARQLGTPLDPFAGFAVWASGLDSAFSRLGSR